MKNILKKSISCCLLFASLLLCCTACGTETEPPDTIEDILNPNRNKQETETETGFSLFTSVSTEESTQAETETTEEALSEAPETMPVAVTEVSETQILFTEEVTEPEFPEETEGTEVSETVWIPETYPVITEPETEVVFAEWEEVYREFLERKAFQRQVSAEVQEADTRFLLLYLNDDNTPELFIQTTMEVLIYTCYNGQAVYVDSFYPSHYTYDFYYRPYRNCLGSLQGSVMADGTYLEIYEYEENPASVSGLVRKETYCYPTRDYSYEIYAERGMNIDLDRAPALDVHPDRQNNIGSSWITVPDVLENSVSVPRYEITEESLNVVFGTDELPAATEPQEGRYAFR